MKKLVIIHGVTGAIGSACMAEFASKKDFVVYGISRKAVDHGKFCEKGILPVKTIIFSLNETSPTKMANDLSVSIDVSKFSHVYYIHAVGVYPFELNDKGEHIVSHDYDKDGIDDRCQELTNKLFLSFWLELSRKHGKRFTGLLFGGLADKHRPVVHSSWWKTIKKTVGQVKFQQKRGYLGNFVLLNISSVLCPNEIISRPFVFTKTDSDPAFWLLPWEVSSFVSKIFSNKLKSYQQHNLFKKNPNFVSNYYEDKKFTPRKRKELFGK